jgi:hypothetical protein
MIPDIIFVARGCGNVKFAENGDKCVSQMKVHE